MRTSPLSVYHIPCPPQPPTTTIPLEHALALTRRERCPPPTFPRRLFHLPATPRNGNPRSPHTSAPLLSSTMTNVLPPPSKFTRDQLVRNLQVGSSLPLVFSCSTSVDAPRSSALSRLHYRLSYPSYLPCPVPPPHLPPINGNCPPLPIQKSSRGLVPFPPGHSKSSLQKMASSGKNPLPCRSRIRSSPQ